MVVVKLDEKKQLEIYAVKYFLEALDNAHNRKLIFLNLADPPDPDVYCLLGDDKIGIEVAHLFGGERDARRLLGRGRPDENTKEQRIAHALVPLNGRVISNLNSILEEKAQKRYGSKTWLIIRNAHPLWNREDFDRYKSDILIPQNHSFEEIWLLCDRDGSSGILRLFP